MLWTYLGILLSMEAFPSSPSIFQGWVQSKSPAQQRREEPWQDQHGTAWGWGARNTPVSRELGLLPASVKLILMDKKTQSKSVRVTPLQRNMKALSLAQGF